MKNLADKKLSSFNVFNAYINVIFSFRGLIFLLHFIYIVIWKFFLLQYFRKINIRKIDIINVDHELDSKVPFKEEYSSIYLDFVNYWIRPLSMLFKKFGHLKGIKLCALFFKKISNSYNQAYIIYSKKLSTTKRPIPYTKAVKNIQNVDPHFCCVPSLHIAIIALTISFYKTILYKENFTEDERKNFNKEIWEHGIKIAESVLYMKQHSVNCIATALYMMTKTEPTIMNSKIAKEMINDLFIESKDITEKDKTEIRKYIQDLYLNLLCESSHSINWYDPILNWLQQYKA